MGMGITIAAALGAQGLFLGSFTTLSFLFTKKLDHKKLEGVPREEISKLGTEGWFEGVEQSFFFNENV
ncbi:hypothetical protein AAHB53_18565 [Niallia circulans]